MLPTWSQLDETVRTLAKTRYLTGDLTSTAAVARAYGVTHASVRSAADRDEWATTRRTYQADRIEGVAARAFASSIEGGAKRLELLNRLNTVAEHHVERALHTMDTNDVYTATSVMEDVMRAHEKQLDQMKKHDKFVVQGPSGGAVGGPGGPTLGGSGPAKQVSMAEDESAVELTRKIVRAHSRAWSEDQRDEREAELRDRAQGATAFGGDGDSRVASVGDAPGNDPAAHNQ